MSLFWVILVIGVVLVIGASRRRKGARAIGSFEVGESAAGGRRSDDQRKRVEGRRGRHSKGGIHERRIHLGDGVWWGPGEHPNPHVLIVGGSGSGKSWTIRFLAGDLIKQGYRCVLFDFHGDLEIAGVHSCRIALDSEYGVNPLEVSMDRTGGGPDPQRFEVLELLRSTFKPMGALQAALLDECIKAVYHRFGIRQEDPTSWRQPAPHLGQLEAELEERIRKDPKDLRVRGLKTKLSMAFDFGIFSHPGVPFSDHSVRLEFSKLPVELQYMAADTLLRQILRRRQLDGVQALSTYLLVDESKLCTPAKKDSPLAGINRVATEGRKFGLGLIVSTQFAGHVGRDVLTNTFTKILMRMDRTEIADTARKFRLEEAELMALRRPGEALVSFADALEWKGVRIANGAN